MNLNLHFIEDSFLDGPELTHAAVTVGAKLNLASLGIDLICHAPRLIRSDTASAMRSFEDCIIFMQSLNDTEAHIIFLDLELVQYGLSVADAVTLHNSHLPLHLCITATADEDTKRKSAGYLLAWLALNCSSTFALLVYTSGAWSAGRIRAKTAEFRQAIGAQSDRVPHMIEDDSMSSAEPATKQRYLENALNEWLEIYWTPLARLHPKSSERWFTGSAPVDLVMQHNRPATHAYVQKISEYLSKTLQLPTSDVAGAYGALSDEQKDTLHEHLMCVVGAEAACHWGKGRGRRLKWQHLPLLAESCCPPPGHWIYGDPYFPWNSNTSLLPATVSDADPTLLAFLIGNREGTQRGLFEILLTDKRDRTKSRLDRIKVEDGACLIHVTFDTSRLAENYQEGVRTSNRPRHDCSGSLWDLHSFLGKYGGKVTVTSKNLVAIERRTL